ncbi:DUF4345 family protein [Hyphomonas sp.]|jgi:hypothetical protein|uniref:DUF4345 family protein n=1 Tax=Hyphomonas sp. TaxID=87 RepID=UPI001A382D72|nr:DUF4345 family protein [Hyphomonas sp.]|tara:strand:- start:3077 stop:3457 length:381 start_codon:yes stop_codon:yes gene_type:complete
MFIRIFLSLLALTFLAFGIWSLLSPAAMSASMGVELGGPNGIYEARGIYGGVSLGAGLLATAGVFRPRMVRPALWFITTYMGGYVFARIAGLIAGDAPTTSFLMFVGFETACLVLAVVSLAAYRPE